MKISFGTKIVGVACLGLCLPLAQGQSIWSAPAAKASCCPKYTRVPIKLDDSHALLEPVNWKAVVYVLQDITLPPFGTAMLTSRVGLDGSWVGANRARSYIGFTVAPGVHHLCVGVGMTFLFTPMIILRQFEAKAGATYYFRVQYIGATEYLLELEPVDEDEGQFLIQTSAHSTSHLKNKH